MKKRLISIAVVLSIVASLFIVNIYSSAANQCIEDDYKYVSKVVQVGDINKMIFDSELARVSHKMALDTYKIRYEFKEGLEYVSLARGALSGMARSVLLTNGETSQERATLLYDCELTDYGAVALVNSFGLPAFPNINYPTKGEGKNALTLELMLKSGKMLTLDYDVSDQMESQPHGGVIVIKDIVVKREDGVQNSGAFDVDVNDWGPYEDVIMPLI